jgi:hypothetical protein
MDVRAYIPANVNLHKLQQGIKWTVYTLLLINFGYYIAEDWNAAVHTLGPDAGLVDWAGEFATSIDEAGWFLLLAMFELETYILEDEAWTARVARLVHGVRAVCYLVLAHTVYAYFIAVMSLAAVVPVDGVMELCELRDRDVSYVYNLHYSEITAGSCGELSSADRFYWLEADTLVSDAAGLALQAQLAWVDLAEAVIWLFLVLAIEVVVRLQNRNITEGALIRTAKCSQIILYLLLVAIAAYWATLSHWLYVWDEFVWIAGFAAIEMNISEWRRDILDEEAAA